MEEVIEEKICLEESMGGTMAEGRWRLGSWGGIEVGGMGDHMRASDNNGGYTAITLLISIFSIKQEMKWFIFLTKHIA